MSDAYQPIYDAVRSRLAGCDIGQAAREAVAMELSGVSDQAIGMLQQLGADAVRPFVLMRPALSIDGNKWCALYGENLQDGVAGFGDSPDQAMLDFDRRWYSTLSAGGVQ